MRPDLLPDYPRLRIAASSAITVLGLFLLVFLGARAFTQIRSDELVRGKPRVTAATRSEQGKDTRTVHLREQTTMALMPTDEAKSDSKGPVKHADKTEAKPLDTVGAINKKRP